LNLAAASGPENNLQLLPRELRVRVKINSQIFSVEAPAWQGAKAQEYPAYSELSQHSQVGCIGT
jgi:hypothetical protein